MIIENSEMLTIKQMVDSGMKDEATFLALLILTEPDKVEFYDNRNNKWTRKDSSPGSKHTIHCNVCYRTKQVMCELGGVKFPLPVSSPLKRGDKYYYTSLCQGEFMCYGYTWDNDGTDKASLKGGFIQLTKQGAELQAKAMSEALRIAIKEAK